MWMMIGLLGGTAQAGDVWVVVDDPRHHIEVPAEWFVSDGGSAQVGTRSGPVDLTAESARLRAAGEGAQRAWPLAEGQLRLEHRPTVGDPASLGNRLSARFGGGWSVELELGTDAATAALGPVDAAVQANGLQITVQGDDLLAPLRRAAPTTLYRGTDRKGREVRVALE